MIEKSVGELKSKLFKYLQDCEARELLVKTKDDGSILTNVDEQFSKITDDWVKRYWNDFNFFSEEDQQSFEFPMAVLDPIDGTNEFASGSSQYCYSLAMMESPELANTKNWAYIYNPSTGFELLSSKNFLPRYRSLTPLLGFVSRSEYAKGLHGNFSINKELSIVPVGSIALKLAFLAVGSCDFVYSLRPKNIWDIAAGTILCHQRGIAFYENGELVTSLDKKVFKPPLIWAHKSKIKDIISML